MKHPRNQVYYPSANAPALAHTKRLRPSAHGCSLGLSQAAKEQVVAAQKLWEKLIQVETMLMVS